MKRCSKCQKTQSVETFSKSRTTPDGLQSQCKACNAAYYATHKKEIIIRHAAYSADHKKEKAACDAAYRKSPNGKAVHATGNKRMRAKYPLKTWCRTQFNNAVRDGKIRRGVCIKGCTTKADGHHLNYQNPFAVIWLCRECHVAWHRKPLNQYFLNRMNEKS